MSAANKQNSLRVWNRRRTRFAGWLGSYGAGQDSPFDISRGLFRRRGRHPAGCCGCFDRYKIKTSWFIPGHSIEKLTFPEQDARGSRRLATRIGAHGLFRMRIRLR